MRANWKYINLEEAYELVNKEHKAGFFEIVNEHDEVLSNVSLELDYNGHVSIFSNNKEIKYLDNVYIGKDIKTARRRIRNIIITTLKENDLI